MILVARGIKWYGLYLFLILLPVFTALVSNPNRIAQPLLVEIAVGAGFIAMAVAAHSVRNRPHPDLGPREHAILVVLTNFAGVAHEADPECEVLAHADPPEDVDVGSANAPVRKSEIGKHTALFLYTWDMNSRAWAMSVPLFVGLCWSTSRMSIHTCPLPFLGGIKRSMVSLNMISPTLSLFFIAV